MTWLDDIPDARVRNAYRVIGNQDAVSLRHMIRALELFGGMLNTPADNERLAAAKIVRAYHNRQKGGNRGKL